MNEYKLLENAASQFRFESDRFDSTVNKFNAAFRRKGFKYEKIKWDGKFEKFDELISKMLDFIEHMRKEIDEDNGDTTGILADQTNVKTAINNLTKILEDEKSKNTESAMKEANEYLNTIVNNTKLANKHTFTIFESFETLYSEKKEVKGREEKEDGTFKRVVPKFEKRKDGDKEKKKKGIKKLNVKKVMEPNGSNEKMINLSLEDNNAANCLEDMNDKIKPLIKRWRYIFPDIEYEEAKSFVAMRAMLNNIYEESKRLLKEEPDTEIFNDFDEALNEYGKNSEDSKSTGNITAAFVDLLEIVLEVAKRAAKLGKKADQELQKSLEPIFEKKILTRLSKEEGKDGAVKNFNNMYKEFKLAVKKISPKWYKFMETMCSPNKIKQPTNGALMALLLISCCAADDIPKADAICRSIRKITKDFTIKDIKYIKMAEKLRQKIKSKILSVNSTKSLYEYIKGLSYTELVGKTLRDTILREAEKLQKEPKKKVSLI